jgi:hypothetical protein
LQVAVEEPDNGLGDGHVHAEVAGAVDHGAGGVDALGDVAERADCGFQTQTQALNLRFRFCVLRFAFCVLRFAFCL